MKVNTSNYELIFGDPERLPGPDLSLVPPQFLRAERAVENALAEDDLTDAYDFGVELLVALDAFSEADDLSDYSMNYLKWGSLFRKKFDRIVEQLSIIGVEKQIAILEQRRDAALEDGNIDEAVRRMVKVGDLHFGRERDEQAEQSYRAVIALVRLQRNNIDSEHSYDAYQRLMGLLMPSHESVELSNELDELLRSGPTTYTPVMQAKVAYLRAKMLLAFTEIDGTFLEYAIQNAEKVANDYDDLALPDRAEALRRDALDVSTRHLEDKRHNQLGLAPFAGGFLAPSH